MSQNDKKELLLLQNEYCYNAQLLDICEITDDRKIKEQFTYDISSIETLKNLVRAQVGIAIIPELCITNETEKSYFKPLKEPKPVREISLVVTDTFSRKLLLEQMSKSIWDFLPQSMKENFSYRRFNGMILLIL